MMLPCARRNGGPGVEQRVDKDGVGVQIDGSNNTVTILAGAARLALDRRHLARAVAGNERELLLTERRATDLVGRDADLAALEAWRDGAAPIACRCLVARAGTGKTRLAIELCERAERAGWIAGFVRHEELRRFAAQQNLGAWQWPEKTLVVVDYAAAAATVLRPWLEALARRPPPAKPLRLLLLERHADAALGWWAELARPGGLSGDGPDALLDPPTPVVLPSLARVAARRALLAQAMEGAARVLGRSPAPVLPPPGTDAAFERRLGDDTINNEPLYLIMAGLVAVTTGAPTALAFSRVDLAMRVAAAERERLDRIAAGAAVNASLFRHLAACVTLQGGCDAAAAAALVEEERASLGDRSAARTDELVALLATALPLPGSGDVDAVRPDLIGEAFLYQHLATGRTPAQQRAIVTRAFVRAGVPVVTSVVHAAQDLAEGSATHPAVAWLDALAERADDAASLIAIAGELPQQTLALRERAAAIAARIVEALRATAGDDAARRHQLAGWLNDLSARLADLGWPEAALDAIEEAAAILRDLAAARPEAFAPDLAQVLNSLSVRLADLGQREAALDAIEEAVAIRRDLAAARPDAPRDELAMALGNLSGCLADLGRRAAALAANEEAVAIRRDLVAARPEAFAPDLALSLNNLSNRLSDLGRHEAGLTAIEEAVAIRRDLAAARPDAFRPDLAASLNNLSNRLAQLERNAPALAAIEEAVAIRRDLAAARPDAFRADLAQSLNNLAVRLADLGHSAAALAAIEESVALRRDLAAARPDAFAPDLALSLGNLSNRLAECGERAAALAAAQEAVALRRDLAAARPDAFRPDLAVALWTLAGRRDEVGDLPGSLDANAEAIAVLAEPFLELPAAFAARMTGMLRGYLRRCQRAERPLDDDLIGPVVAALDTLNRQRAAEAEAAGAAPQPQGDGR